MTSALKAGTIKKHINIIIYQFMILIVVHTASMSQDLLSREAQLADIESLESNFERYHPGFYRYTDRETMFGYFDQVRDRVEPRSKVDFFGEVTWLLNKVKCGHTRASMPVSANNTFKASQLFLPLKVKYLGERLVIEEVYTNDVRLESGEELLSINERSIEEINADIFSHHSSDGNVNSSKYRITERYFHYYYQLYVNRGAELYRLRVRGLDGKERSVTVTGEDWQTMQRMTAVEPKRPLLSLRFERDHALMDIRTFVSYSINNVGEDYYEFLEESFAELKKRGTQNLILDLRGNGGGDDNYGATLVSYFAKTAFGYFDRIEVTDAYSGYGSVSKEGGRNLMTSHKGLSTWQPKANRFDGKVYVLIDGWSFSTCADVATVLHHNGWATFLGEETGGGYDGNTSGNSRSLTLSNSGIRINLPMWMYTTANVGHKYPGRGAMPDFPINQSPQDLIEGKDAVMEKALALIRK